MITGKDVAEARRWLVDHVQANFQKTDQDLVREFYEHWGQLVLSLDQIRVGIKTVRDHVDSVMAKEPEPKPVKPSLTVVPFQPKQEPGASVADQLRAVAAAMESGQLAAPQTVVMLLVPADDRGVVGMTTVGQDIRRMELIGVLNAMATIVTLSQPDA